MQTRRIIRTLLVGLFLTGALVSSRASQAQQFSLNTLVPSQLATVATSFGKLLSFRPAEPASDLGAIWGLYFGVGGSLSDLGALSALTQSPIPFWIPMADFQIGLGLPLGITLQAGFLPGLTLGGQSFSRYSIGVQWTATRTLLAFLPLSLAARLSYSNTSLRWNQTIAASPVTITYTSGITSLDFVASKQLPVIEPYLLAGLVNHGAQIGGSTSSLFGTGFPASTTVADMSTLSYRFAAGLQIKLLILAITPEYEFAFGSSSVNAKVAIKI